MPTNWSNTLANWRTSPELYMRAMHNALTALFCCDERKRFQAAHLELVQFVEDRLPALDQNQALQAFFYTEVAQLNLFFLKGEFSIGAEYCFGLEEKLALRQSQLDVHRAMILYYKMAAMKFGAGDHGSAVRHLQVIIHQPSLEQKEDIQCYARLLNLIAHYEIGNFDLIEPLVRSTYRFLLRLDHKPKTFTAILSFLKRSVELDRNKLNDGFRILKDELKAIMEDRYEQHSNLYLDLISWLESKLDDRLVEEVIMEKRGRG